MIVGEFENYEKLAKRVEKAFLQEMKIEEMVEVELCIISKEEIKEINLETRNVDKPTDVLSFPTLELGEKSFKNADFPFDQNPETGALFLGSILICEEVMKEQAKEFETGEEREFSYLLTHGLLHLLGFDHMEESEKSRMREKEELILKLV